MMLHTAALTYLTVWSTALTSASAITSASAGSTPQHHVFPPPADHIDETVLRFELPSREAHETFASVVSRSASTYDLWSLTKGSADVKLRKSDIDGLLTQLPVSFSSLYSTLIPDVAAAIAKDRRRSVWSIDTDDGAGLQRTVMDGPDNLFFRDYQNLSVRMQFF